MKAPLLISLAIAITGTVNAAPPDPASEDTKPGQDLGEVKAEKAAKLEKAIPKEEVWTQARYGAFGQFVQAPNLVAPINPLAKPHAGTGETNLSRDTVTRRIMGLRLLKLKF